MHVFIFDCSFFTCLIMLTFYFDVSIMALLIFTHLGETIFEGAFQKIVVVNSMNCARLNQIH